MSESDEQITAQPQDSRFLSVAAFARLTGLSVATVRRRVRDGSVVVFQPGGPRTRVLIPWTQLQFSMPRTSREKPMAVTQDSSECSKLSGPAPRWRQRLNRPIQHNTGKIDAEKN
jgi:hypothetical protein